MNFNARPCSHPGASPAALDTADGAPSGKADEATTDDFAAAMAETGFAPRKQNRAETVEEKHAQESPSSSGKDNLTTTPALLGPPVCWAETPTLSITSPVEGADSEPVSKAAFSIANLFAGNPTEAQAETATAGATTDQTIAPEVNQSDAKTGEATAISTVTSSAAETAEPGFYGSSGRPAKSLPAPVPLPVMLADPRGTALDGGPRREPGRRPSSEAPQGLAPFGDLQAGSLDNPRHSNLNLGGLQIPGLARRFNLSEISVSASVQADSKGQGSNHASPGDSEKINPVLLNQSELCGKASLLQTAFREVVRAAAESQPPAVSVNSSSAALPHQSGAADNDGNPAEAAGQADSAGLTLPTDNPSGARDSAAASADPSAAALGRQIESPLLEMARNLTKRETRSLRLQLRPEKFGQISLQITRGGDGRLSAQLAADLHVTQHALAEGINQLRESLEQSGLAIDRLEVSLGLDLRGESGGHQTPEETAPAGYGKATPVSNEPAGDSLPAAGDKQGRRLSLRI